MERLAVVILFTITPALLCAAGEPAAVTIRWSPERPFHHEPVTMVLDGATRPGVLHWGVNPGANGAWSGPHPTYRPPRSVQDGAACRSPFGAGTPGEPTSLVLGPFTHADQVVTEVVFTVQWDDGAWLGEDQRFAVRDNRIVFNPPAPSSAQTITVTVQRAAAGSLLHWGVNRDGWGNWQEPHPAYWPEGTVPTASVTAVESPLSPPDADGTSQLVLGPFHYPGQPVTSVHMVIKSGKTWDNRNGRDYAVAVAADDTELVIVRPQAGEEVLHALNVEIECEGLGRLTIWVNDQPRVSFRSQPYSWVCNTDPLAYGEHRLTIEYGLDGARHIRSVPFFKLPERQSREAPGPLTAGATRLPDGTVRFALRAPGLRCVSITGSFVQADEEAPVMWGASRGWWWLDRKLSPERHAYRYLVDGNRALADPFSTEVSRAPAGDGDPPRAAWSVLDLRGEPPYRWQDPSYTRRPWSNQVIYECNLADVAAEKGFDGLVERLAYLQGLGVDTIELMPVTEYPGKPGWGYNPAFHFAVESAYGAPDRFRRLVDVAHGRGMAVVMDLVLNHLDRTAPLYRLYGENYDLSPWFSRTEDRNWGMPDLDQEARAVIEYVDRVITYWIRDFHVDGFRFDATRFTGWDEDGAWGASWYAAVADREGDDIYTIAEHIPQDPALVHRSSMDAQWDLGYCHAVREVVLDGRVNRELLSRLLLPLDHGLSNACERVIYTDSHDEQRMACELRKNGHEQEAMLRRVELAHAILCTSPGVIMLYAGQEFAQGTAKKVGNVPVQWGLLRSETHNRIRQGLTRLLGLRRAHPAFTSDTVRILHVDDEAGTFLYQRSSPGSNVLVFGNAGSEKQRITVPFQGPWTWRDVVADRVVPHEQEQPFSLDMEPGTGRVLTATVAGYDPAMHSRDSRNR